MRATTVVGLPAPLDSESVGKRSGPALSIVIRVVVLILLKVAVVGQQARRVCLQLRRIAGELGKARGEEVALQVAAHVASGFVLEHATNLWTQAVTVDPHLDALVSPL